MPHDVRMTFRRSSPTALLIAAALVALSGCAQGSSSDPSDTSPISTVSAVATVPSPAEVTSAATPSATAPPATSLFSPCQLTETAPCTTATTSASTQPTADEGVSGLEVCPIDTLPLEVDDTIDAVLDDGPYLRPRNDGGRFGNYEGILPRESRNFYREYTVEDPGARFPGPRRIVTGGQRRTGDGPQIWFYTDDHYESFCEITGL